MKITKAGEGDLAKITQLIQKEFPYVERNDGEAVNALRTGTISIFKAVEKGKILGFVEVVFLEQGIARINGLTVLESKRGKGIGKKLFDFAIEFLKKRKIERIVLFVKQSNTAAKELYSRAGFLFTGLVNRKIDNALIEEMELGLSSEPPQYVS